MTLTELLSLNEKLSISLLQDAYEDVVSKLRLNPAAFPAKLTGACTVGDFSDLAYLLNGSEVAFKKVTSVEGVTFLEEYNASYTVNNLILGNYDGDGFGFTGFDEFNDAFLTTPTVYWSDGTIICSNLDEAFLWITGYVYPYFVCYGSPYTHKHYYDIQTMVTEYGGSNLTVDPVLAYPTTVKALSLDRLNESDLISANALDNMTIQFIELYNAVPESMVKNYEPGQGETTAGEL